MNKQERISELVKCVQQTRRYGQTYVKAGIRREVMALGETATLNGEPVRLSFTGWGRSLASGGHKYKAHCNYCATGKPVPSKHLMKITAE